MVLDRMLGTKAAAEKRVLKADHAAHGVLADIERIRAVHGADVSLQALARELMAHGVATPRGGAWTATAVRRVLARV